MHSDDFEGGDARQVRRDETLKGAFIISGPQKTETHCLITNISPEGAELQFDSDVRVPQHFVLRVPNQGVAYRSSVRWRDAGRIGIMFDGKDVVPVQTLKAVSA